MIIKVIALRYIYFMEAAIEDVGNFAGNIERGEDTKDEIIVS